MSTKLIFKRSKAQIERPKQTKRNISKLKKSIIRIGQLSKEIRNKEMAMILNKFSSLEKRVEFLEKKFLKK